MLEIITDIDLAIQAGAYRAALALALTIPDICGHISSPNDNVGIRYRRWFDSWVKQYYPFGVITGDTCYKMRCAYLHSGNSGADESYIKTIDFYVHSDGNSFHDDMYEFEPSKNRKGGLDLIRVQINIAKLCAAMCAGARDYYNSVLEKSVFDPYSISILNDPTEDYPYLENDSISVQIS